MLVASIVGTSHPSANAESPPESASHPHDAIVLQVDATDVARGIFRVRETVPIERAGKMVLLYPKWLPGYHAPAGPIEKLGGLSVSINGKALSWERDPTDTYAFGVQIPEGVAKLDIEFQYLSPVTTQQGRVVTTPDMLALEWNTVALYPQGNAVRHIQVAPSVKLPDGWAFATTLEVAEKVPGRDQEAIQFQPVSLERLIDSPLYAGSNFQRFSLDHSNPSTVSLNVFADRPAQIAMSADMLQAHRNLVQQADRLFGTRPFDRYEILLTLSNHLGGYGLEHRRSSENSVPADYLLNWERSMAEERLLVPHEYVHSWNGKFRRSIGLLTPHYNAPASDTLLWMYEGLTEYWGQVLAARSGLHTPQQSLDSLAVLAATAENRIGRRWRPLADTLHDPIIARNASLPWPNWQRGADYYPEGPLLWLDVDTKLRELSGDKRSLDDFARRFYSEATATAEPLGYDLGDIAAGLNAIQPHDWASLLQQRLTSHDAPLAGLERGGWRLVYRDVQSDFSAKVDARSGGADLSFSLGLSIGSDAMVRDVQWGSPAFDAGLTIETKLIAVNGVAYDHDQLKRSVTAAKERGSPIQLLALKADRYRTVDIAWRGGLRYPHLERVATLPNRLTAILAPRK